jgi:hypothetical protein
MNKGNSHFNSLFYSPFNSYLKKGVSPALGNTPSLAFRKFPVGLLTQTKSLDEVAVAVDVLSLQVSEQTTTLSHKLHKGAVSAMIFVVGLHVFGQVRDTVGEQSYLALARTSICVGLPVLGKDLFLSFWI